MCMQHGKERGAILIMTAIFSIVLIGIAALALDVGRLFVLHSEMHNAADAAALAAAAELDGRAGTQTRAMAAARDLLSHSGRFAKNQELLKEALSDDAFTFYCAIGSEYDIEFSATCAGDLDAERGEPYYLATGDSDSHYVKVTLENVDENEYYLIDLLFLPVLTLLTEDVALTAAGHADAIAGKHDMICNYPPLMICDPFEGMGGLRNNLVPGQQIQLKAQGPSTSWSPGDFGYLEPTAGPGAANLKLAMADEGIQGCTPRIVSTEPGEVVSITDGYNTRFDVPSGYDPDQYPPAPNVIDYPDDPTTVTYAGCDGTDCRIGNNDWDRSAYWAEYHYDLHGIEPATLDFDDDEGSIPYSTATRYQVYKWEIEQDKLPCSSGYPFKDNKGDPNGNVLSCSGNPSATFAKKDYLNVTVRDGGAWETLLLKSPGHGPVLEGIPSDKQDDLVNRRILHIATLRCDALGVKGKTTDIPVINPDGFATIFLIKHSLGPPYADIDGEYVGWTFNTDSTHYVEIQLYE